MPPIVDSASGIPRNSLGGVRGPLECGRQPRPPAVAPDDRVVGCRQRYCAWPQHFVNNSAGAASAAALWRTSDARLGRSCRAVARSLPTSLRLNASPPRRQRLHVPLLPALELLPPSCSTAGGLSGLRFGVHTLRNASPRRRDHRSAADLTWPWLLPPRQMLSANRHRVDEQSHVVALDKPYLKHAPRLICTDKHFYSLVEIPPHDRIVKDMKRVAFADTMFERASDDDWLTPQVTFHRKARQGNLTRGNRCRSAPRQSRAAHARTSPRHSHLRRSGSVLSCGGAEPPNRSRQNKHMPAMFRRDKRHNAAIESRERYCSGKSLAASPS